MQENQRIIAILAIVATLAVFYVGVLFGSAAFQYSVKHADCRSARTDVVQACKAMKGRYDVR